MNIVKLYTLLRFSRLYCETCRYFPYFPNGNKSICPKCKNDFVSYQYTVPGFSINTVRVWTDNGN